MYRFDIHGIETEKISTGPESDVTISGQCDVIEYGSFDKIGEYSFEHKPGVFSLHTITSGKNSMYYNMLSVYIQIYCEGIKKQKFFWSGDMKEAVFKDCI